MDYMIRKSVSELKQVMLTDGQSQVLEITGTDEAHELAQKLNAADNKSTYEAVAIGEKKGTL